MLSNIFISKLIKEFNRKTIDLNSYSNIHYKIFTGTESEDIINLNPLIELLEIFRELGFLWGNGLRVHVNNFSDLTEKGKENKELLNTHRYIEINNKWIHLAKSPKRYILPIKRKDIITIEDILEEYYKYKAYDIGIKPNIKDIKLGDFLYYSQDNKDNVLKIIEYKFEKPTDTNPQLYKVILWSDDPLGQDNKLRNLIYTRTELSKILEEEDGIELKAINRKFKSRWIQLYDIKAAENKSTIPEHIILEQEI